MCCDEQLENPQNILNDNTCKWAVDHQDSVSTIRHKLFHISLPLSFTIIYSYMLIYKLFFYLSELLFSQKHYC